VRKLDVDIPFTGHLGAVGDARKDIRVVETRIILEDFAMTPTGGEQIKDQGNPNPVPPDTRLAEANARSDRNARQQLVFGHYFKLIMKWIRGQVQ
jgi:hypothetical protein